MTDIIAEQKTAGHETTSKAAKVKAAE